MPTDTLVGAKVNMVWDGLFHAGVWTATAIGIAMLWRIMDRGGERPSSYAFAGSLLLGWGLFNMVEGVIDHHLLQLHHVYERAGRSSWDWLFLAFGATLVTTGWLMIKRTSTTCEGNVG